MGCFDIDWHHLAVLLRCGKTLVAEKLLDVANIGTFLHHVGGAAAAQGVRGGALVDSGRFFVVGDSYMQSIAGQRFPFTSQEQPHVPGVIATVLWPDFLQILFEKTGRRFPQGHDSLSAPLSFEHKDDTFIEFHIPDFKGEQFASPDRRCIKHLQRRPVTNSSLKAHIGLLQELLHFLLGKRRTDLFLFPADLYYSFGRVDKKLVGPGQVLEEPFNGPYHKSLALHGLCSGHDVRLVVKHDRLGNGAQIGDIPASQVFHETVKTPAVLFYGSICIIQRPEPFFVLTYGYGDIHAPLSPSPVSTGFAANQACWPLNGGLRAYSRIRQVLFLPYKSPILPSRSASFLISSTGVRLRQHLPLSPPSS